MKAFQIELKKPKAVRDFVAIVQKYPYEVILRSGGYHVDAKSILGIFSLDLLRPVNVEIRAAACDDLIEELTPFFPQ